MCVCNYFSSKERTRKFTLIGEKYLNTSSESDIPITVPKWSENFKSDCLYVYLIQSPFFVLNFSTNNNCTENTMTTALKLHSFQIQGQVLFCQIIKNFMQYFYYRYGANLRIN